MANLYLAIFFVNNASINAIVGKLLDLFVMEIMKKYFIIDFTTSMISQIE